MLLYVPIAAGFDFEGSHFTATFTENSTIATVVIPIIADLNSNEGTEYFSVHMSLQSREILSDLPYTTHVRLGSVPQATVNILDGIILNFQRGSVEVDEGQELILNVTASRESDRDSTFSVSITRNNPDVQCKLLAAEKLFRVNPK